MKTRIMTLLICFCSLISFGQISFKTLSIPASVTATYSRLMGISFADTSIGYACGDNGFIIKTIDGGEHWSILSTGTSNSLMDIKVVPNTNGMEVIVVGAGHLIKKTKDGGLTWVTLPIPISHQGEVTGIQCLDSLNYFACGETISIMDTSSAGSVLRTRDGGATWEHSIIKNCMYINKIFMLDTAKGYTVGIDSAYVSFSGSVVHLSGFIKKGLSGAYSMSKSTSVMMNNLWCTSASDIVAIGNWGQIWKSSNAGSTWERKDTNTQHLFGIQFINPAIGFACGWETILYTKDSGNTWSKIPYTPTGSLQSICIVGDKIFMCGQGQIIKADLTKITNITEKEKSLAEISIYPNPAKNRLFIENKGISKSSIFKLFDNLGKTVLESKFDAPLMELNIESINSGNYLYTIEHGSSTQSGKIIIAK